MKQLFPKIPCRMSWMWGRSIARSTQDDNSTQKKIAVFWVVAPFRLVQVHLRFRGAYCLHHQGDVLEVLAASTIRAIALMVEAGGTSETSVNLYQSKRHNNPEDSHLHTRCRENLKSEHTKSWMDVHVPSGIRTRDPSHWAVRARTLVAVRRLWLARSSFKFLKGSF
jgi:hypothetical protein